MKYQIAAAGAAVLAPVAAAAGHNRHADVHRAVETRVHWHYETVTQTVTAATPTTFLRKQRPTWWPGQPASSSSSSVAVAPSSSSVAVVPSSSSVAVAPTSSSVAVVPTSSSVVVVPTSSSVAVVPSSSSVVVIPSSSAAPSSSSSSVVVIPSSSAAPSSSSSSVVVIPSSSVAVSSAAPATSTTSSAVAATSTAAAAQYPSLYRKSGLSGYVGIQDTQAFDDLNPYISWYSDYTADTPNIDNIKGVGMLWGADGSACTALAAERLTTFNKAVSSATKPEIMFGFYEPDCYCDMSSEMSVADGITQWNAKIAPLKSDGTILGSPSMCKQRDEDWLTPFMEGGLDQHWDVTSLHINKPDLDGIKADVEYYLAKYKKPLWISEFACVHDADGWTPCTDQAQVNQFIYDAVNFFQANESVVAYGPSNGEGLGTVWPLTDTDGNLTPSGITYFNAIKGL